MGKGEGEGEGEGDSDTDGVGYVNLLQYCVCAFVWLGQVKVTGVECDL